VHGWTRGVEATAIPHALQQRNAPLHVGSGLSLGLGLTLGKLAEISPSRCARPESQLGLTLREAEGDVEIRVIDSIDRPEDN
jgi:hypothetical protein